MFCTAQTLIKAPSKWSSLADFYAPFRPKRNGSYRFEVKIGEKIIHDGYITTVPELSASSPVKSVDSVVVQTLVPKEGVISVLFGLRFSNYSQGPTIRTFIGIKFGLLSKISRHSIPVQKFGFCLEIGHKLGPYRVMGRNNGIFFRSFQEND